MQIKKSPREASYPDTVSRYERERFTAESDAYASEVSSEPYGRPSPAGRGQQAAQRDESRSEAPVRSESLIDRHSSFDGRFETEQDLRIEGAISGEVICRGLLTLEKDASARARVQAREANIKGRLEGDIVCSGRLTVAATAAVTGTIKAPILVVEEGASISGNVDTTQKAAEPVSRSTARAAETPAPEPAPPVSRVSRREVPSFALVSSEVEPAAAERR